MTASPPTPSGGAAIARAAAVSPTDAVAPATPVTWADPAREAARIGVDGVMVMPALVYSAKPHETAAHFRGVASATACTSGSASTAS